ncbi:MAG: YiaA/YiaB family inner membrane protein [Beijerinckiaceae bacterium]
MTTSSNSPAWVTFTYISFGIAAAMTAIGIWALPGDLWQKGYMAMAAVMLTGSCFTLAKTLRDEQEAKRLSNRLDEARAEKLLLDVERAAS